MHGVDKILYSKTLLYGAENVIIDGNLVKCKRADLSEESRQSLLEEIYSGDWEETTIIQNTSQRQLDIYSSDKFLYTLFELYNPNRVCSIYTLLQKKKIVVHLPNSSQFYGKDVIQMADEYLEKKERELHG